MSRRMDKSQDSKMAVEQLRQELADAHDELSKTNSEFIQLTLELEDRVEARTAELKDSQAKLIQTEKYAAVGTLTAGVAHELNNPMMGILNFIQYGLKHIDRCHKTWDVLKEAENETRRCTRIVQNLLTFSRIENAENERLSEVFIPDLFERVVRLLSYRMEKENVTVDRSVPGALSKVAAKPSNLQQVFLNLMGNALDAVKQSSQKKIEFAVEQGDRSLRIDIRDTGTGIADEDLPRIFDPFFTTKPVGQGTGLGLSISQGIIRDHGGRLTCRSRAGHGTTFSITLPTGSSAQEGPGKGSGERSEDGQRG